MSPASRRRVPTGGAAVRGAAAPVLVAVLLLGGCGAPTTTLELDGWSTGGFLMDCTGAPSVGDCARMVEPAVASLDDDRERRTVKVYEEGPYIDAAGSAHRVDRGTSPIVVVVVTYADGARRAVGIYCAEPIEGQAPPACTVTEPPFAS